MFFLIENAFNIFLKENAFWLALSLFLFICLAVCLLVVLNLKRK
jgi:hypothetical protein